MSLKIPLLILLLIIIILPLFIMQILYQIPHHLNTKAVLLKKTLDNDDDNANNYTIIIELKKNLSSIKIFFVEL